MIDFAGFDNGEKPINQDLKMKYVTTAVRRQGSDRPSLLATFTIAPTGALLNSDDALFNIHTYQHLATLANFCRLLTTFAQPISLNKRI